MIKHNGKATELEFGKGDIGFGTVKMTEDGIKKGGIMFYNQKPREIGSEGDIKVGEMVDIRQFPVFMSFSKKESVDALIEALNLIKKHIESED